MGARTRQPLADGSDSGLPFKRRAISQELGKKLWAGPEHDVGGTAIFAQLLGSGYSRVMLECRLGGFDGDENTLGFACRFSPGALRLSVGSADSNPAAINQ
jgi:hypothetical protein